MDDSIFNLRKLKMPRYTKPTSGLAKKIRKCQTSMVRSPRYGLLLEKILRDFLGIVHELCRLVKIRE